MAIDKSHNGRADAALQPWQLQVAVADDALEPLLAEGQMVIVDCSDRALESGGIYAVRDGDALVLWLFLVGFNGQGCRLSGQSIGTLTVLGGGFRLRGPLATDRIRVVGRVVKPLTGNRPALADLAAQQARLAALRETTRAALLRLPAARQCLPAATSINEATAALQRALAVSTFADRFALEQRLDAIDARQALIEELIAQTPADGLADVVIKLGTLAALDVDGSDALESRLLRSALDSIRRLAGAARRPGRETQLAEAMAVNGEGRTTFNAVNQPLELTASPRRRS